jgi:hypothetical protein
MSHALLIYARVCGAFWVLSQNAVKKSFEFLRISAAEQLSAHDDIHLSLMDCDNPGFQFDPAVAGDTWVATANYSTNF